MNYDMMTPDGNYMVCFHNKEGDIREIAYVNGSCMEEAAFKAVSCITDDDKYFGVSVMLHVDHEDPKKGVKIGVTVKAEEDTEFAELCRVRRSQFVSHSHAARLAMKASYELREARRTTRRALSRKDH